MESCARAVLPSISTLRSHGRIRSNENKISDGYRERAPIEVEMF
jgi:hypothetical protein